MVVGVPIFRIFTAIIDNCFYVTGSNRKTQEEDSRY